MEIELGIEPWEYQGIIPPQDPDHWYLEEDSECNLKRKKITARRVSRVDHR